jgi:NAD(P)-dependent dehydrogenase (short-subunit alcohol dehydrogenase family)
VTQSKTPAAGPPVALVTGAAGGLGRAVVARLRERGMRLVATDLALAEIPCGAPLTVASLDVTDEAAIAALISCTLRVSPVRALWMPSVTRTGSASWM